MVKESHLVCGAFCMGIFLAAFLVRFTAATVHIEYFLSGVTLPALALWMLVCLRRESLRHSAAAWWFTFTLLGTFCMASGTITAPLGPIASLFATSAHGTPATLPAAPAANLTSAYLRDLILSIPFRDHGTSGLLLALVSGDKSLMSPETVSAFRTSGGAHLLALSGMHLGIIYLLLRRILAVLGNRPVVSHIRSVTIILATALYTWFCGCGPSLMRAWLFIALWETSRILHRPQDPGHIFCTALTLHLILTPTAALQIGFQLSYLAMVGIVFLWPHVRTWYKGDIMRRIWDLSSLSICCQLFTGPLTLFHFGTFPRLFLVTNLVAAPLMGVVMICGIAAIALAALTHATGIAAPEFLYHILEYPFALLTELIGTISALS